MQITIIFVFLNEFCIELYSCRLSHQYSEPMSTDDSEDETQVYATDSVAKAYSVAESLALSNISAGLRVLSCLPVTSCEAERAFSKLGFIKTDLRSTTGYER